MLRSFPSIGGPAFAICAFKAIRTVTGSHRIASAAPRSRIKGATTSPDHEPSASCHSAPRRSRIAAA